MIKPKVWKDQQEFNLQVRPTGIPTTHDELSAVTKEFSLHLVTEISEFLEAGRVFGAHRKRDHGFINRENVRRQLIDQLKYWMSIAQAWGFTPEELEKTYWAKSATVRQRFAEEWLINLDGPLVVLDLDNVLCDYTTGFMNWLQQEWRVDEDVVRKVREQRHYINADLLRLTIAEWNDVQHSFRSSGATAKLPVMPFARQLVEWCRAQEHAVVAMTSRPIDQYPNLMDDTVEWFLKQNLLIDRIWWGSNKAEKLAAVANLPQIKFAVDDDPRFVTQLVQLGVKRIYWYQQGYGEMMPMERVIPVRSLDTIIKEETLADIDIRP